MPPKHRTSVFPYRLTSQIRRLMEILSGVKYQRLTRENTISTLTTDGPTRESACLIKKLISNFDLGERVICFFLLMASLNG